MARWVCRASYGGDHHLGQVEIGEQWLEFGDFVGLGRDLAAGDDRFVIVGDRRQQVHLETRRAGRRRAPSSDQPRSRPDLRRLLAGSATIR